METYCKIGLLFRLRLSRTTSRSDLFFSLQVLLGLAFSASAANLVFIALRRVPVPFFPNYLLEAVLLLVALPLTYLNHQRTRRSSTLLLLFWPIYTLFTVVWTRSVLHAHHPGINRNGVVGLRWAAVGFGLFAFAR